VNEKFSPFQLEDHEGRIVNSSDLTGKKIMLVFIRGKVTENLWCPICFYQYLELAELQQKENLKERFNIEIFFVLPYKRDSLESWTRAFPGGIGIIENWKNPGDPENLSEGQNLWMAYCKEFFPGDYKEASQNVKLTIPVLFDEDRKVSEGLLLFKDTWGGTKVGQNIPTVYIIDEKGYTQFKYHSQYTNDRPGADYLFKYLSNMF
jgi:peroxiredoxin